MKYLNAEKILVVKSILMSRAHFHTFRRETTKALPFSSDNAFSVILSEFSFENHGFVGAQSLVRKFFSIYLFVVRFKVTVRFQILVLLNSI